MYDFIDLKLIRYISEERTLSAVAQRAKMSLPAISQRLTKLEDAVKVKLVYRSGGFGLTPAGKIFLRSARVINAELALLERQLRAEVAGRDTILRIHCSESTFIDDLPIVLDKLASEHPALHFVIQDEVQQDIPSKLLRGDLDAALVTNNLPTAGLQFTPYRIERACIIATVSHPLAQIAGPIRFRDAMKFDFIRTAERDRLTDFADAIIKHEGAEPHYRAHVNSLEGLCVLVGQTQLGIGLALESTAKRHARTQPIQVIRLADEWATRKLFVCTRPLSECNQAVIDFIEMLQFRFNIR